MKRWGFGIVLAGVCAVVLVGQLFSADSAAAGPHKKPAAAGARYVIRGGPRNDILNDSGVSPATWMHDLASRIWNRPLNQIVIAGSHDSASYSLPGQPLADYAITQTEDLTAQLNDGARAFDLRVEYAAGAYRAHHGIVDSAWLGLTDNKGTGILDEVERWTLEPAHYREILLLDLSIDQKGQPFPTDACKAFDQGLGSALLTPTEAQADFGTTDPGRITPGQLWSKAGPQGPPRVIMDNNQCMTAGDPSAGHWDPDPPFGSGGGQSYYADQCYAAPYWGPGIRNQVLKAAKTRATDGDGDAGAGAIPLGPPMVGGIWSLFVQATTTGDCYLPLSWFDLQNQEMVLSALYDQWQNDKATRDNLNVLSGDYIGQGSLVSDVLAMDQSLPVRADSITRQGPETVTVEQDQPFPTASFAASLSYKGAPVDQEPVTYQVSNVSGDPFHGPNVNGSSTATRKSTNGVVQLDDLSGAPSPGTWKLTASLPDGTDAVTWILNVVPSTHYTLRPNGSWNAGVQIGATYLTARYPGPAVEVAQSTVHSSEGHHFRPGGLSVLALNAAGHGVPGVQVTFDAGAAGGTFPGGDKTAIATTDGGGTAFSPPFTAGTRAGTQGLVASAAGAPTQTVPITVAPAGGSARWVPLAGDGQSTPIYATFRAPLTGHFVDRYGNVLTRNDLALLGFPSDTDFAVNQNPSLEHQASWTNGDLDITQPLSSAAPDGTITAPALRAGPTVRPNTSPADAVKVYVDQTPLNPFRLGVTPGPPDALTATAGDGQQTGTGQTFDQDLAVRVTDAGGNPIPGAAVTFQVSAGHATFPPLDVATLAKILGDPSIAHRPHPPRTSVTVPANADGIATAPALTAGAQAGPIEVTVSAGSTPAEKSTVFHLSAI